MIDVLRGQAILGFSFVASYNMVMATFNMSAHLSKKKNYSGSIIGAKLHWEDEIKEISHTSAACVTTLHKAVPKSKEGSPHKMPGGRAAVTP